MLGLAPLAAAPLAALGEPSANASLTSHAANLGHGALAEAAVGEVVLGPTFVSRPRRVRRVQELNSEAPRALGGAVYRLRGGRKLPYASFTQTFRDGFRAANTALALYQLWVNYDAPVDFSVGAQLRTTSATLPITWTPGYPGSGTRVLYVVIRQVNKFGLVGFNVMNRKITINSSGAEVLGPVSAPRSVEVYDAATGYLRVVAEYDQSDDRNPADTWELYVKIGSDPVPGTDTPVSLGTYATMRFIGDRSGFAFTAGPYSAGADARVILTAKRSSDSERGNSTATQYTLATALDLTDGDLLGGRSFT